MRYYLKAFKNYANFNGRASRRELWLFRLFHYIIIFIMSVFDEIFWMKTIGVSLGYGPFYLIYILASALPAISLQARRLHDVDESAWLCLMGYVPILNWYLLYLNLKPGNPETNKYGKSPNSNGKGKSAVKEEVCTKCGIMLKPNSSFCEFCGTFVCKDGKNPEEKYNGKYKVCIYNVINHTVRYKMLPVDTTKFPTSKFAENNTYYVIESFKGNKKVRSYCTKDTWYIKTEKNNK